MIENSDIENRDKLMRLQEDLITLLKPDVEILSLRPKLTESGSDIYKGDFDYIVKEKDVLQLINVIYNYCKNNGINFILNQKPKNKRIFIFFIDDFKESSITLEFWTTIEFTGQKKKQNLSVENVFQVIGNGNISSDEVLSLLFILHLHHKNKDLFSDENMFRYSYFQNKMGQGILGREIFSVFEKLKNNQLSITDANLWAVDKLAGLNIKNRSDVKGDFQFLRNRIRNKVLNLKKIIPLVGPDGVGKGSVSDQAIENLKGWSWFPFKLLYRVRFFYRLRLSFVSDWKKNPNNLNDEKIKGYIFFMAFFNVRMLALLKKNKVLLDRYFMDYFASPIRYPRDGEEPQKIKFYRLFLKLTPVTNHIIFLGCADTSLMERKNELPLKSVACLQKLNCEYIIEKRVPSVLFLSTENPIETSSKVLYNYLKRTGYAKN